MMHYGPIELYTKILWVCLRIRWFMEKHVTYLLNLNIRHIWDIKELNYDSKLVGEKRLFDISSLDEWRTQAYENAKLFKEKVKRWHDKRIQKREFNVGDYVLLYNSRLRFFAGKLLSKWEGSLRYRGGLPFRCHKNQQLRRHESEGGEWSKNQTLYLR